MLPSNQPIATVDTRQFMLKAPAELSESHHQVAPPVAYLFDGVHHQQSVAPSPSSLPQQQSSQLAWQCDAQTQIRAPPALGDLTRIIYTMLMPVICVLGAIGATICILVFTRRQMRSSLNIYLAGLSAFDLILLLMSLLIYPSMNLCLQEGHRGPICHFFWRTSLATYPLSLIAQTGSVWTCVAITVDRFLAVQYPLHMRAWCTPRRARIVLNYIAIIAVLYKMPSIFELSLDECGRLKPTQLRNHPLYIIIYNTYGYLLLLLVIPFFVIIVFNIVVVSAVRAATIRRRQMQNIQHRHRIYSEEGRKNSEIRNPSRFKFSVGSAAGFTSFFHNSNTATCLNNNHNVEHKPVMKTNSTTTAIASPSTVNVSSETVPVEAGSTVGDWSDNTPNIASPFYTMRKKVLSNSLNNNSGTSSSLSNAVQYNYALNNNLQSSAASTSSTSWDYDKRCTKMAIVTIVTFVLFNWLAGVNNVIEAFDLDVSGNSYRIPIGNLLVCLNSATNILIYSIFGQRFRKLCAALLCPCFRRKYDSLSRSGY